MGTGNTNINLNSNTLPFKNYTADSQIKIVSLLISLIILISCLLDKVYILLGEVTFESLLGVKG